MTTLLAEQPLILSLLLAVLAGACLYGWLQSGKRAAGVAGLLLLAMIPLAWVIAGAWKTDREQLRELIYETADAVEANDIERAVRVIGPSHQDLVSRARAELANYEFTQADVNKIRQIELIENSLPLQADVEMTVTVTVSAKRGQFRDLRVPRRLSLKFEKLPDDRWVVVDYDHGPVIGQQDAYSPSP